MGGRGLLYRVAVGRARAPACLVLLWAGRGGRALPRWQDWQERLCSKGAPSKQPAGTNARWARPQSTAQAAVRPHARCAASDPLCVERGLAVGKVELVLEPEALGVAQGQDGLGRVGVCANASARLCVCVCCCVCVCVCVCVRVR